MPVALYDVENVLAGADILGMASFYEGRPLAVLEAFAAGVCVVSSDIPAVKGLIQDGINGFVFERGNYKSLAGVLEQVMADKEARLKAVKSAKQACGNFSVESFVENVEKEYLKAYNLL